MEGDPPDVDQPQRQLSPVGLYSHAADVVQRFPQMKGTPQQFKAMLTKQGVKPDEFKHSGYDEKFAGKPLVTKQELTQHFNSSIPPVQETTLGRSGKTPRQLAEELGDDWDTLGPNGRQRYADLSRPETKFHSYTLPGGTNYRETLLHLPQSASSRATALTKAHAEGWNPEHPGVQNAFGGAGPDDYKSSHWDTPNVLAHLRMSDRALPGGKKALHLEELQSDWAQAARKNGFKDSVTAVVEPHGAGWRATWPDGRHMDYERREVAELAAHQHEKGSVPRAPYVDSTQKWVDLGLKRALYEAAKGGYDKLVMTPGEEQAKRYDLSQHVSKIHYQKDSGHTTIYDHRGQPMSEQTLKPEQLAATIGKEAAEKLLSSEPVLRKRYLRDDYEPMHVLEGGGLKIGGEGMKAFYDQMLPQALEKLAKKHDPEAKVHLGGHMLGSKRRWDELSDDERDALIEPGQAKQKSKTEQHRLHSLDITPKMRASILKGQPAYAGGGRVGYAEGGMPTLPDHPARIPTRLVTSKKAPSELHHNVDMASFRSTPELYQKNVDLLRDYPNTPKRIARQSHDKLAEQFIEHAKNNLLDLHDRVPAPVRARSKLWYVGANKIVKDLGKQYNLPDHSVAGAIAALSPQKDWFQNVSLAKRVIEAMHGGGRNFYAGFTTTPAMEATFKGRSSLNKPKYMPLLEAIKGKSLMDLDQMEGSPNEKAARKALWIRLHDETYNSPSYPLVTPEGDFGQPVKTKGGAERKAGWGSLTEISKAIRSLESAKDPAALSQLMGEKHKVRNFYNNMLDPNARHGDVTIDTHAVAAALMRALAGESTEVAHNFSNSTDPGVPAAGGSAISGIQGTYPLYAEAYRRAARERGILPREMQSITWEAVRSMFNDTFKSNKNNVKAIDDIWHKYRSGKITQKQAQEQVYGFTGGLKNPDWFSGHDEAPQHPADPGELPRSGFPGPAAVKAVPRAGGRPARAVPAEGVALAQLPKAAGGAVDHDPTPTQKEAGNYRKERLSFQGLPISIENKAGSTRHGVDDKGKPWSARLPADYGYVRGTEGADGDHVDCFVGPHRDSPLVVIVNQRDLRSGRFDEHKCMLGFDSERDAVDTYRRAFSDGHGAGRIQNVQSMSVDSFKHWLKHGRTGVKAHGPSIVERALAIARSA